MKLIAKVPILYFAHLYQIGDELPLQDQTIRIAGKVYGYASKTYITKNGAAKKSIGKSALKSKNTKNNISG